MPKKKLFSDEFVKEAVKVFIYLVINLYFDRSLYSNTDVLKKVLDVVTIILVWAIYLVAFYCYKIKNRPIQIQLVLKNKINDRTETDIVHVNGRTREDCRTIKVEIKIKKLDSIWTSIALRKLKNKSLELVIQPNVNADEFCLNLSTVKNDEVIKNGNIFKISISKMINQILQSNGEYFKRYELIVNENRDNLPQNTCYFEICSSIEVNSKELAFPYNFLFEFKNTEFTRHKINFFR